MSILLAVVLTLLIFWAVIFVFDLVIDRDIKSALKVSGITLAILSLAALGTWGITAVWMSVL